MQKLVNSSYLHSSANLNGSIVPFNLSDIGEGIREVNVLEWFIQEGDRVSQFDPICEVQSDKAAVTITSRYDGIVVKLHYETDDTALVGNPLVDIELDDDAIKSAVEQVDHSEVNVKDHSDNITQVVKGKKTLATPAVRRIAIENNIRLEEVTGTGPDNRVLKEDVVRFVEERSKGILTSNIPKTTPSPEPSATAPSVKETTVIKIASTPEKKSLTLQDRTEPLKGILKAMTKTMELSMKIPHFGYCDEIDLTNLVSKKKQLKKMAERQGVKFTYMPIFIKAASLALNQYPILNSSLDKNNENIIYKASHNIGFAMDTPSGLLVPNIKGVQSLSLLEIAKEMERLIILGKNGKLGQTDLSRGTFTLSNIGSIGGTYTKPVLLPSEAAIGGLGKIQKLPRFDKDDQLVKAYIMQISWSADHRIIDGATMAHFTNLWKSYLEEPLNMMMDL